MNSLGRETEESEEEGLDKIGYSLQGYVSKDPTLQLLPTSEVSITPNSLSDYELIDGLINPLVRIPMIHHFLQAPLLYSFGDQAFNTHVFGGSFQIHTIILSVYYI